MHKRPVTSNSEYRSNETELSGLTISRNFKDRSMYVVHARATIGRKGPGKFGAVPDVWHSHLGSKSSKVKY